jgi:hypothetical protein
MNYNFFDLLALPLWIFLIIDALYSLKKGKSWRIYARLAIGLIALIADFIFAFLKPFG